MSRSRNIKPGFFDNEDLAELPFEYRLLFIGLWCNADRDGRFEDRPTKLKMAIFPADSVDVDAGLTALQRKGFILRYASQTKRYGQIIAWKKHQNPHFKEQMSVIPSPESLGFDVHLWQAMPQASTPLNGTNASGISDSAPQQVQQCEEKLEQKPEAYPPLKGGVARLIPDSGFLIPDSLKDQELLSEGVENLRSRFDEFWSIYPVRKGKADAAKKWKLHKLDVIADVILADVRKRLTDDQDWLDGYIPHGSTYVNGKGWEDGMKPLRAVNGHRPSAPSKTLSAIQVFEERKRANLDRERNHAGVSKAHDPEPGTTARLGFDRGDADDVA